jgi:hypothetical protein
LKETIRDCSLASSQVLAPKPIRSTAIHKQPEPDLRCNLAFSDYLAHPACGPEQPRLTIRALRRFDRFDNLVGAALEVGGWLGG